MAAYSTLSPANSNPLHTGNSKPQSVLILGDSISAAYGIPVDQGWVTRLALAIADDHPEYNIINASISGETSGGALTRLPDLLKQYQPAITIIELGGNDGLRGYPISSIRNNLSKIVQLSLMHGQVLLLGMQIPPNYGVKYTQLFSVSYSLLAEQYQLSLVPFFLENIATEEKLMQADGIHPGANAQLTLLRNVLPYLKPLLLQALPDSETGP